LELHQPKWAGWTYTEFIANFEIFLHKNTFVPITVGIYDSGRELFLRMYFVNVKDEKCVNKFFC